MQHTLILLNRGVSKRQEPVVKKTGPLDEHKVPSVRYCPTLDLANAVCCRCEVSVGTRRKTNCVMTYCGIGLVDMVKPLCVIGWKALVRPQRAGPLRSQCCNKEVDYLAKQALKVSHIVMNIPLSTEVKVKIRTARELARNFECGGKRRTSLSFKIK